MKYYVGLFLLTVLFLSGCTLFKASLADELNLISFNVNCNGQNSCSPGQNAQLSAELGPLESNQESVNISSIDSINLAFVGTNITLSPTNFNADKIKSDLESTGKAQITLPFDTPYLIWGEYQTILSINYTTYEGQSGSVTKTASVTVSKPDVSVSINTPLFSQNGYQFLKLKNNEARPFEVIVYIYTARGAEIQGSIGGSPLHAYNSSNQNYYTVYRTDKFVLNPNIDILTEAVISKGSYEPTGDYQTKVQIFWTQVNETPMSEVEGSLHLG